MIKELTLLTAKPSLYVANISEDEVSDYSSNEYVKRVEEYAKTKALASLLCPLVSSPKLQVIRRRIRRIPRRSWPEESEA